MNNLKGVNKQIIEINYTKDDYVQKAILIINPEKSSLNKNIINKKAFDYMDSLKIPKPAKKQNKHLFLIQTILSVLLGAGIMAFIIYLV